MISVVRATRNVATKTSKITAISAAMANPRATDIRPILVARRFSTSPAIRIVRVRLARMSAPGRKPMAAVISTIGPGRETQGNAMSANRKRSTHAKRSSPG